jgi:hypothetical protein
MLDEFEGDVTHDRVYPSKRLTEAGHAVWGDLLRQALGERDEQWLQAAISPKQYWLTKEEKVRNGKVFLSTVPPTAAGTLAEGEFVRYYLRGVARRAVEDGGQLQVARMKQVDNPRSGSEALVGKFVDAVSLLADLRANIGLDTVLGIPAGPNSGLGVEIVSTPS